MTMPEGETVSQASPEAQHNEGAWWKETVVRIRRIRSGQPRPYADSEYVADIIIETTDGEPVKWNDEVAEPKVREVARAFVRDFADEPAWHQAALKVLRKTAPGTWHVEIVQPYLD